MSDAHVITHVKADGGGWYTSRRIVAVILGDRNNAELTAEAMNVSHGYDDRDEDGFWFGPHHIVETVPILEAK